MHREPDRDGQGPFEWQEANLGRDRSIAFGLGSVFFDRIHGCRFDLGRPRGLALVAWAAPERPRDGWPNLARNMVNQQNHLFAINGADFAHCGEAATGKEAWKVRLSQAGFIASPVLVDDKLYAIDEAGTGFVFAADPKPFKIIAENPMGDDAFANPEPIHQSFFQTSDTAPNEIKRLRHPAQSPPLGHILFLTNTLCHQSKRSHRPTPSANGPYPVTLTAKATPDS